MIAAGVAAGGLFTLDDTACGLVRDALRRDRLAELAQVILAGSGLLAVGVVWAEPGDERRERRPRALRSTRPHRRGGGMAFFVAANNLMTLFLGLEWFSVSLYILTAMAPNRLGSLEAALKYLIVGSFGSAVLLFGSALVYGATGSLYFDEIAAGAGDDPFLYVAGLSMLIVGLEFKISAAPFHMWTPDVYQGAPTPVTGVHVRGDEGGRARPHAARAHDRVRARGGGSGRSLWPSSSASRSRGGTWPRSPRQT